MLQKDKTYYTYKDLTIVPTCISNVEHRSECNPYGNDEMLPLFTAPMDTVVNKDNFDLFESEGIHAILPRTESIDDRLNFSKEGRWAAYSLNEFEDFFSVENGLFANSSHIKALIDIANGHMLKSFDLVRKSKEVYGDKISIMVGNIANPTTYEEYAKVGADYIRLGIGAGRGCFDDGTTITLKDGLKKPIEEVCVGDEVLTHNGTYKTVLSRTRFKTKDKKLKINNEITCTEDHKFYVINKKDKDAVNDDNLEKYAFWVEASNLDKEKHLLIKRKKNNV